MTTELDINKNIVAQIRARDRGTLTTIYKEGYPMVEKYIINNSGSAQEAQDIFQDALYILIKKAADTQFTLTVKTSTYLFSVAKNLWLKQLSKNKIDVKELAIENAFHTDEDEDDISMLFRVKHMKNCIAKLGEPCSTIITQFYFLKTSMKQIAALLNYTNANNAKNQKYKCFIRLKKMVLATHTVKD